MPRITLIIKDGGELLYDVDGYEQNPAECENVIKLLEARLAEQGLEVTGIEQIRHPASLRRIPQEPTKQVNQID